ncbi:hypothetical protein LCGC14_0988640 [marine sediment metagenome]|uniref:Nudix hydrolase domain-containing protein n=1 Tax=marine sediment metagenome TaxID=412755 RepID=A0A0F9N6B6_9ZZZZ
MNILTPEEIIEWVKANALYIHPKNKMWQAKLKEWEAQLAKCSSPQKEDRPDKGKKQYVIGFLFRSDEVALIQKNRPDWQIGKLNGIGGHIEQGETPLEAMKREFNEEAGELIDKWEHFCTMNYPEADIYCFRLFGEYKIESKTDEVVSWYSIKDIPDNVIPNLHWLIPLAHYDDDYLIQVTIKPDQISALFDRIMERECVGLELCCDLEAKIEQAKREERERIIDYLRTTYGEVGTNASRRTAYRIAKQLALDLVLEEVVALKEEK